MESKLFTGRGVWGLGYIRPVGVFGREHFMISTNCERSVDNKNELTKQKLATTHETRGEKKIKIDKDTDRRAYIHTYICMYIHI